LSLLKCCFIILVKHNNADRDDNSVKEL